MENIKKLFSEFLKLYEEDKEAISEMTILLKEKIEIKANLVSNVQFQSVQDNQLANFKRMNAKHYGITYPSNIDKDVCLNNIKNVFSDSIITIDHTDTDNLSFFVECRERKNIYSNKKLFVSNRVPMIRTFNTLEIKNRLKMYNIDEEFKSLISYFTSFLNDPNKADCLIISQIIKSYLEKIHILLYSEYLLSTIVINVLLKIGITSKWSDDFRIISIDTKMEEHFQNKIGEIKIRNFRCDLLIIKARRLFIFEFKFRFNRKNNQLNSAINCIIKKRYFKRVLEYLQKNYPQIYNEIKEVVLVGCSYSLKSGVINCGMNFRLNKIK